MASAEVAADIKPAVWRRMPAKDRRHIRKAWNKGGQWSETFARRACNAMHKLMTTYDDIKWSPPLALLAASIFPMSVFMWTLV